MKIAEVMYFVTEPGYGNFRVYDCDENKEVFEGTFDDYKDSPVAVKYEDAKVVSFDISPECRTQLCLNVSFSDE